MSYVQQMPSDGGGGGRRDLRWVHRPQTGDRRDKDGGPGNGRPGDRRGTTRRAHRRVVHLLDEGTTAHADYLRTGAPRRLDRAVSCLSRSVDAAEPGHPHWYACTNNLGVALLDRFKRAQRPLDKRLGDLDEAIHHLAAARDARSGDSPDGARAVVNLISALLAAQQHGHRPGATSRPPRGKKAAAGGPPLPDLDDLRRELAAMTSGPVRPRLDALRASGLARARAQGPAAGYEDLAAAVRLLPRAIGWAYPRGTQGPVLADVTGLAADAASCAVAAGKPVEAVRLFEAGRALQWDQLSHRSVPTELRAAQPRLAARMDRVARRLADDGGLPDDARMRADDRLHRRHRRAHAAWERLAASAQTRLETATLQLPDYHDELRPAAGEGPIVQVVASRFGCYALLVRADRDAPQVLELTGLSYDVAQSRARGYLAALNGPPGPEREQVVLSTLHWLWEAVGRQVLDAVSESGGQPPASGRLWWCPSGVIAALPLHAATRGGAGTAGEDATLLHVLVSSYTPTIRVLTWARRARETEEDEAQDRRRMLLVTVAGGHGTQDLPAASRTREHLTRLVPPAQLTRLQAADATWRTVHEALERHAWAHFDCHGIQDLDEPFDSGLVLHDRVLTIGDLARFGGRRSEFAFLAACTTALPGARMPDEMISLTSALQYTGYQHVIGTQSPVPDRSAARVAMSLYDALASGGALRPDGSARVLRDAVLEERVRRPDHPSSWVSFVHVGI
jgi:hypothetical protein